MKSKCHDLIYFVWSLRILTVLILVSMLYYEAVKFAFHELTNAKDRYVLASTTLNTPMNKKILERYLEVQAVLMAPIIPHFSEHVWRDLLKKVSHIIR
jgi:leucyl-tRNA synthetase